MTEPKINYKYNHLELPSVTAIINYTVDSFLILEFS